MKTEIEIQKLIEEAKTKGYKIGVTIIGTSNHVCSGEMRDIFAGGYEYREFNDKLLLGCVCIYKKGEWAEIVNKKS